MDLSSGSKAWAFGPQAKKFGDPCATVFIVRKGGKERQSVRELNRVAPKRRARIHPLVLFWQQETEKERGFELHFLLDV